MQQAMKLSCKSPQSPFLDPSVSANLLHNNPTNHKLNITDV